MEYKDYYKILGVDRNADADAIKKAYRKLARQYHPDVNKGDKKAEERFKEINEANDVLSDPEKRKVYDQLGTNYQQYRQAGGDPRNYDWNQWAQQAGGGNPFRRGSNTSTVDFEDLDLGDFFEAMFGGRTGARTQSARRPRDVEQPVQISLEEAYQGATRLLRKDEQDIEVSIPAGVKTGSRVRMRGQGPRNSRGQTGDLYLVIDVAPDTTYERKDDDLYRDVRVNAFTAMLGGEVTVSTLSGNVVVTVPAGTSSGRRIRLRGRGMPKLGAKGQFGDLYLRVMVTVPREISDEDRKTLEKIAKRYSGD
jgi:curved DNA-binding protein